ncbi:hypothetical protein [Dongia sp.]|uniref:hypothetical protein n=1 Tax=Dongia sp. TaxID=1977262 RepID=UPI0035B08DA1
MEKRPRQIIDEHLIEISMKVIAGIATKIDETRQPYRHPEPFKTDGVTVQMFLSDDAPDGEAPIYTVRFDAIEWRAWVRHSGGNLVYGNSVIYELQDLGPDVNICPFTFGTEWVVEFRPTSRSILSAFEHATSWLEKHHISLSDAFAAHESARWKRGIMGFFR